MDDLISRQAAIDAFLTELTRRERNNLLHTWTTVEVKYFITKMLENLPSAQPERKKGKWIIRDNPGTGWYRVTCSECGEDVTSTIPMIGFFPNAKPLWDYCPYCGCKTKG